MNALQNAMGNDWITEFNAELFKWKLDKTGKRGVSLTSIRLVELMANAASDSDNKNSERA